MGGPSVGSLHIACPSACVPRPPSSVKVLPASLDLASDTPSTHSHWSSEGSARIWLKYIGRGFRLLILVQLSPASVDLYSPPSWWPSGPLCSVTFPRWPPRPLAKV